MVMQPQFAPLVVKSRARRGLLAGAWVAAFLIPVSCMHFAGHPDVVLPEPEPASPALAASELQEGHATRTATAPDSGCIGCHQNATDPHSAARASCVRCHGGDGSATTEESAHPEPHYKKRWPTSANPERSYLLTMEEDIEWIRFVNPGDLRVADETCGGAGCHSNYPLNVAKSVMTTSAPFWGVAAYANGIVSSKFTLFGESYASDGTPQKVNAIPKPSSEEQHAKSVVPFLIPLPNFEISHTGNIYRVFEQGSRLGTAGLGLNGANSPVIGVPDKLEDGGKPNNRLSDRGFGTLNRVDLPLLNVHKTRLNDPHLSFMGTNDNPGDYRSSGCTACHMVYANDRSVYASGPYAAAGNRGRSLTDDPTIPKDESGHPIRHKFTVGIPSSQCMTCHHHQPNSFVNSFFGFTMWNYESDGERMWPDKERHPSNAEMFEILDRNPEAAAQRSLWSDYDFLAESSEKNADNRHTLFADYHGHGWIFRGAFRKDRSGNLLDADGKVIPYDTANKFAGVLPLAKEGGTLSHPVELPRQDKAGKPVLLQDVHAEVGMHCVDCHFTQDVHGNGKLFAEYQAAVEIRCQDCHGTASSRAMLRTTGPAAEEGGRDLLELDAPWDRRKRRFEVREDGSIVQRSMLYEGKEWVISQVADSIDPNNAEYNAEAAYAKRVTKGGEFDANAAVDSAKLAHGDDRMECYSCHSSWVTACFGCHLPQQANWRTEQHHFDKYNLRNYATYNPQVVRDAEFLLGVAGDVKGNKIAPVRSSSAVMISSQDGQRRSTYIQQSTVAANGMNGQCFNTHFPHTVRKRETRECSDCHISEKNDNNAWMAQLLLQGTGAVNFIGMHAYVGLEGGGFDAVQVTEWDEPQAVMGSHLHEFVYPERFRAHVAKNRVLDRAEHHGGSALASVFKRGEYLYSAGGTGGFRAFDIANVANKDFSEKMVTSPVSPLGQDTHEATSDATCVRLGTTMATTMTRIVRKENHERTYRYGDREQNLHEMYRYAYVADREEGLIVIDVDVLTDGDPRNNFTRRVAAFNPDGALDGAVYLEVAGTTAYVCCDAGLVAVSIEDPQAPRILSSVRSPDLTGVRAVAVQFRYAFVCDARGVQVIDVTFPDRMRVVPKGRVEIADARGIYVAKTYAYVAAGAEGLAILDVEKAEEPRIDQVFNADGAINDAHQVVVGMTNDSFYAYVADGVNGLRVIALVSPNDGGRSAYGFSPRPEPSLIATYATPSAAISVARGLDRDRAVDESGNQVAIFGRIGGRPMNRAEMERLYLRDGAVYTVSDDPGRAEAKAGK